MGETDRAESLAEYGRSGSWGDDVPGRESKRRAWTSVKPRRPDRKKQPWPSSKAADAFVNELKELTGAADPAIGGDAHHKFRVYHIDTAGESNVLGNNLTKHGLLRHMSFRMMIIRHYREVLGFDWVDIVLLNRRQWYIFIWGDGKFNK